MTSLIPTPNVQPDFRTTRNGHTGMNRIFVAPSFSVEIGPEDSISCPCLERHPFGVRIALDELAPAFILRLLQSWEVRLGHGQSAYVKILP